MPRTIAPLALGVSTVSLSLLLYALSAPLAHAAGGTVCSADILAGTWKMASFAIDGKPSSDPELNSSVFAFSSGRLSIETGDGGREEFTVEVDAASAPCAIRLSATAKKGGGSGWMLFAVEGGTLTLGFHDNLDRRPLNFDSRPKMVVARLARQEPD